MAILLVAEVANGALSDLTVRTLTAAAEIGQPVDISWPGRAWARPARLRPNFPA